LGLGLPEVSWPFDDAEEWSKDHDAEEWSKDHDAEEWSKDHDAEEWSKDHDAEESPPTQAPPIYFTYALGDVETRGELRPSTASQAIANARPSAETVDLRAVAPLIVICPA
jgi:hypothetical protein